MLTIKSFDVEIKWYFYDIWEVFPWQMLTQLMSFVLDIEKKTEIPLKSQFRFQLLEMTFVYIRKILTIEISTDMTTK